MLFMIELCLLTFITIRCEYIEIDERHALEIDDPVQLKLANILVAVNSDW